MDDPSCDRDDLEQALDALASASRHLGGLRLVRRAMHQLLADRRPGALAILDVGAGGGALADALGTELEAHGWTPRFVLLDRHRGAIEIARMAGRRYPATVLQADGAAIPLPDGSVDIALCCTTLHHLGDDAARRLIGELERVARAGWLVTDVRRSRIGYLGVRFLAATLWRRNPFPRVDGPISVRRAFTPEEAMGLARAAGRSGAVLRARLFRWSLSERLSTPAREAAR